MSLREMRYEGYISQYVDPGYFDDGESRFYSLISLDPKMIKLVRGITVDVIAATVTAAIVAPISAFLDRGITESAAGKTKLWTSVYESAISAISRPWSFFRSPQYLWPFALYAGTYGVANASETICDSLQVDRTIPQLTTSTVANMSLSMMKDGAFARIYGLTVPTALPAASYGFWFGRDVLSMFFFFTVPPIISKMVNQKEERDTIIQDKENTNLSNSSNTTRAAAFTAAISASAARFLAPVIAQFFTTPLHLLGLDTYNRKNVKLSDRITFLKAEFPVAIGARIGRIIPAYSFGGVCNASIRQHAKEPFCERVTPSALLKN
uniref:Uncharacterized protein n=1 Tax=Aureoumbra lagunensis TaxID=44058 RepID=A0A7S3JYQ8_9STRA|mmetsp:Transcript_1878/g.2494  ORF Transcript_1878/g.2494 Transcript_1878/m.2494 type:complete len:323 (-) Transcript_1878:204-1172(-)